MEMLKNYINGEWTESLSADHLDVENPSTGAVLAKVPLSTESETDMAVEAARKAFASWSATPVSKRVQYLYRFLECVQRDQEKLMRILSAEMGKSLPDAAAEIKRMEENIQTACAMPSLQQGTTVANCADGIDAEIRNLPVGVFALIAPFNFPAMVPFWFIPYAIASGNTYVAKPSELVPMTLVYLTELFDEIGLPPGVFNLINGDKTVGERLMEHRDVKGVSFVGSTKIAYHVARTCASRGKRFQAMGGAKNHLVVMPDAHIENTVKNMITSCFGCAGQRCMAASAIVCVGDETYEAVKEQFIEAAGKLIVADPLDPAVAGESVVMGPVINGDAKKRIEDLIATGISEGAKLELDGRNLVVEGSEKGYFTGATVFSDVKPGMEIHNTEIFGPVVVMLKVETLEEAIAIINEHRYGNGASIYTAGGLAARTFKQEVKAGMIGVNIGIPAPVGYLPFGGMKDSLLSDIKAQGAEVINFFTEKKIVTERFW